MMTRRDWLLQQLGITQWKLRHQGVTHKEIPITLLKHIRLLLVASPPLPPMNHPLVADVVRSMGLTLTQLYRITPEQAIMLPNSLRCHCWWLGLDAVCNFDGISFHTQPLETLSKEAKAKRELWRHIINN